MVFIKTKTEYDSQLFETIYKRELEVRELRKGSVEGDKKCF